MMHKSFYPRPNSCILSTDRKLLKLWRMISAALISLCILLPMVLRWSLSCTYKHTLHAIAFTIISHLLVAFIFLVNLHFTSKVTKPLLETSRSGYLAAVSASSYSFISLLQHFLPIMNPGNSPYQYALSVLFLFWWCFLLLLCHRLNSIWQAYRYLSCTLTFRLGWLLEKIQMSMWICMMLFMDDVPC